MSYFYAEIKYPSNHDDSRIKNLISSLLQEYGGTAISGVGTTSKNFSITEDEIILTSEPIFTNKNIRYQFPKEDNRNNFINSVNNLGEDLLATTFP
ncbi:MAG: hypothetical protein ACK456_00780 [Pseudanabaenaceae cyanobacterium]|jgi:hypothetical protein